VGWSGVKIPAEMGFFFAIISKTSTGAHPASYSVGTKDSFPGGKVASIRNLPPLHYTSSMMPNLLPLIGY
jgi:hypothetical protein